MAKQTPAGPTVLDWFLSLLRLDPIPIPEPGEAAAPPSPPQEPPAPPKPRPVAASAFRLRLSWAHLRLPSALVLGFLAQLNLERHQAVGLSVGFYLLAAALLGWGLWAGDFGDVGAMRTRSKAALAAVDPRYLAAGIVAAALTYLLSSDNTFRFATLITWIASALLIARAFWVGDLPALKLGQRLSGFLRSPRVRVTLDRWSLLVLGALLLSAYFRFAQLEAVPQEMWSDHAEKYLDIVDVLNGNTSIFFPRNAGREPIQFYATAAAIKWLGADFSYLTLKTVTALAGWLTLPYMYLFGKQLGGRSVGLAALALTGIAYWPNVLGRVGMRLPFFPIFLAPAMYYLLRGLQERRQNDLVLTGLFLGVGIYGYTPARIAPLVIALGIGLYLAHRASKGHRRETALWLAIAAAVAIVVAVPFLRTAFDFQDEVFYRTVTRVTDAERPLPGPPLQTLLSNYWNALRMFSWDFGEIWVLAIPFRPALDWVTGGLFHLGVGLLIVRYVKRRDWSDLFLLLSIPILLLPSVLSLAFPGENPHPSRAGGAIVPVFTIAAIAMTTIWEWSRRIDARRAGVLLVGGLFLISAVSNYNLVIHRYGELERRGAWNTTQVGAVARGFGQSIGSLDDVYVVAYPHWMDSRLVALIAGRPGGDFALLPQTIDQLEPTDRPQLFLLHPDDADSLSKLQGKYPQSNLTRHFSPVEGRDFLALLVPGGG